MSVLSPAAVLVAGVGTMGTGIAQVAAQAGHTVFLFDLEPSAAIEAKVRLASTFDGLVGRGKLTREAEEAAFSRLQPVGALSDAASVGLAIEAVTEDLTVKRTLLGKMEALLAADAVLATNTSSLSITALAAGLKSPDRLVGLHFFNPVPLMKLVEVVSGLHTAPAAADAAFALLRTWGKVPIRAQNTPGFIVNRIARPFYAETLALLQERAAPPPVIDACLRGAGFRMGPCELMDLIGHDTNFAVTRSVYESNFFDKRYAPSVVQRELVDGGLLGRKSDRGFYRYPEGPPPLNIEPVPPPPQPSSVTARGRGPLAEQIAASAARALGRELCCDRQSDWTGLTIDDARLVLTEGAPACVIAARTGVRDIAVFDRPMQTSSGQALAYAVSDGASSDWQARSREWLHLLGFTPQRLADTPGLVVARTIAMLINEAADAVLQGVCTEADANDAMKLGVNYPAGPFEWLRDWGVPGVVRVLDGLDASYRGERYRVSPLLQRRLHA